MSQDRSILPERALQRVRYSAPSLGFYYLQVSLKSSCSCISLLPRRLLPSIFSSVMYFRRQFLHKICQIQLSFLCVIACRIFLYSFLEAIVFISHTIGSNDVLYPSPPHFQTFKIFRIYFGNVQFLEPYRAMLQT